MIWEIIRPIFSALSVDGREKHMTQRGNESLGDYYRENKTYPTLKWMVENAYPTYAAKVKSRSGDLEKDGRGLTEFKKKCESTIRKAHSGGFPDLGQHHQKAKWRTRGGL